MDTWNDDESIQYCLLIPSNPLNISAAHGFCLHWRQDKDASHRSHPIRRISSIQNLRLFDLYSQPLVTPGILLFMHLFNYLDSFCHRVYLHAHPEKASVNSIKWITRLVALFLKDVFCERGRKLINPCSN